ncbi:hypothetical protein ABZ667_41370 [Streptomyces lavendulae]|uniref:hypothetical protein n=1 Tax=Streptomyces lavendulae TaxID=1914 RepID=UPI0033F7AF44
MKTHRIQLAMAAGLSALALFTVACTAGGSDNSGTGSSQDAGAKQAEQDDCLRSKGFKIEKGGDGKKAVMLMPDNMGPEEHAKALEDCGIKDQPGGGGSGGGAGIPQADKDKMLAHAACMRKEGIDFSDPTFGAGGEVQSGVQPEQSDPEAYKKADKTCAAKAGL